MVVEFAVGVFGPELGEDVLYAAVFVVVLIGMLLPYLLGAAVAAWVVCRDVGWRFWHASAGRLMCGGLIFMATPSVAQVVHG